MEDPDGGNNPVKPERKDSMKSTYEITKIAILLLLGASVAWVLKPESVKEVPIEVVVTEEVTVTKEVPVEVVKTEKVEVPVEKVVIKEVAPDITPLVKGMGSLVHAVTSLVDKIPDPDNRYLSSKMKRELDLARKHVKTSHAKNYYADTGKVADWNFRGADMRVSWRLVCVVIIIHGSS